MISHWEKYFDKLNQIITSEKDSFTKKELEFLDCTFFIDIECTSQPWNKLKQIGNGSFGKVFEWASANKSFAIKEVEVQPKKISDIITEINNMMRHNNPNIIKFYGYYIKKKQDIYVFYLIMEKAECDLTHLFLNLNKKIAQKKDFILDGITQLISALSYLHFRSIAHRDIKPQNILIVGDQFKLADTGLLKKVTEDLTAKDIARTPAYQAPEISDLIQKREQFPNMPPDERSSLKMDWLATDVYSLGLSILEMCMIELGQKNIIEEILKCKEDTVKLKDFFTSCTDKIEKRSQKGHEISKLLKMMLERNPLNRSKINKSNGIKGIKELWISHPLETLSDNMNDKIIKLEFKKHQQNPNHLFSWNFKSSENFEVIEARITLSDTKPPKKYNLQIELYKYPCRPPQVLFCTPIDHPNIKDGKVFMNILQSKWSLTLTIENILFSLISLINDHNPNDSIKKESTNVYPKNNKGFYNNEVNSDLNINTLLECTQPKSIQNRPSEMITSSSGLNQNQQELNSKSYKPINVYSECTQPKSTQNRPSEMITSSSGLNQNQLESNSKSYKPIYVYSECTQPKSNQNTPSEMITSSSGLNEYQQESNSKSYKPIYVDYILNK